MQDRSAGADTANVLGSLHQGILSLFRDDPWLAFDLLGIERPVFGTPIDRRAEVERDAKQLLKIDPRYPDLVLVYRDPNHRERGIVICVEAQGKSNPVKRWRLVVYQALLAEEHRLPTFVVVVSFCPRVSADLAQWRDGPPPRVDALRLDAETVPPPTSLEQGRARPAAAVLGAALHGCRGNLEAARVGVAVALELPEKRRRRYVTTILAALPERQRSILMDEIHVDEEEDELWHIERNSGTYKLGHQAGIERGRRMTLIELILTVLDVRGLALDADAKARIRSCEALATLERWAQRAREVGCAAELFEHA